MIGWFVEQKHVGALKQEFGQLNAHAPSSRKFFCRAVEVARCKSESLKCTLHFRAIVHATDDLETLVFVGEPFNQFHVAFAFVVRTVEQFFV